MKARTHRPSRLPHPGHRKDLSASTSSVGGGNHPPARHRDRLQAGRQARDQKSPRPARQDAGQLLRRAQHAHAHSLRTGRHPPERRCHQHLRQHLEPHQGRDAQGHRAQPRGARTPTSSSCATARAGAAQFLAERLERQHHQRRRRRARASHAGAARHLHHPRKAWPDRRPARHHPRRHPLQPRGPLEHPCADQARRAASRSAAHARWCRGFSSSWACRVTHDLDDVLADADVINLLRIQHERQRKEYFPSLGEYTALFGLTKARAERLKPDALIMHPGPDQPRRGDRQRHRRRRPQRHPRAGHQRPGRAHGGALPLRRSTLVRFTFWHESWL